MYIIKLGGSVITDKSKKSFFKTNLMNNLSKEIKKANKKCIIVHGAGSFGHILAKKYKLNNGYKNNSQITGFSEINIPILSSLPIVGQLFFSYNILVYLAFILVPIVDFILNKTSIGLKIRSVGENPKAAESLGINVFLIRYLAVIAGCALVGLGGAYIPLAYVKIFAENIVKGRGWFAFSIVIFGNWKTYRVMGGALLFGGLEALQLYLQTVGSGIPYEFLLMLPYVLTIIALILTARRGRMPLSLGKPYRKE